MKLALIVVGCSILALFGAVGTLEATTEVIAPMVVIAIATVAGAIAAHRLRKG